jgi:LEA14-like dessication related protein
MRNRLFLLVVLLLSFLGSCGLNRQVREMRTLADCEFRYEGLERASLAGVDVLRVAGTGDLEAGEAAVLFAALALGRLPLDLTVRVGVRNPNETAAAVNRLDWVLLIDDIEMGAGAVTDRVEIAPRGGAAVVPVHFSTELVSAFSGQSGESLIAFALNLAGGGDRPSRVTVRIKPTVTVGGKAVQVPGTITLNQEFSSGGPN